MRHRYRIELVRNRIEDEVAGCVNGGSRAKTSLVTVRSKPLVPITAPDRMCEPIKLGEEMDKTTVKLYRSHFRKILDVKTHQLQPLLQDNHPNFLPFSCSSCLSLIAALSPAGPPPTITHPLRLQLFQHDPGQTVPPAWKCRVESAYTACGQERSTTQHREQPCERLLTSSGPT